MCDGPEVSRFLRHRCHKRPARSVNLCMNRNEGSGVTSHDVVVVGAGLAGLAVAQLCRREGRSVLVLDPHPGGRARSDTKDGFIFNRGPHAVYLGGATERVLGRLGIALPGGPPQITDGAILAGTTTDRLPSSAASLVACGYLGLRDKASLGSFFARLPKLRAAEWSGVPTTELVGDLRERARLVALMAIRTSTYCAVHDRLSADIAVTALQAPGVRYVDGGWQRLVDELSAGVDIVAASVTAAREGEVHSAAGVHRAKGVVIAAGTPSATASLLGLGPFSVDGPIEVASLDLGLRAGVVHPLLLALDEPLYFSMHSPAAAVAPAGRFVAHAATYITPLSAKEPKKQREQLDSHAQRSGVHPDSVVTSRYLHRMTVVGALPSAANGGLAGRPSIDTSGFSDVFIAGDWVGPEGQLADASFASAEAVAARLVKA